MAAALVGALLELYAHVLSALPATPARFHYLFNPRDLSRVLEGLLLSTAPRCAAPDAFVRLWRNECLRVFTTASSAMRTSRRAPPSRRPLLGGRPGVQAKRVRLTAYCVSGTKDSVPADRHARRLRSLPHRHAARQSLTAS